MKQSTPYKFGPWKISVIHYNQRVFTSIRVCKNFIHILTPLTFSLPIFLFIPLLNVSKFQLFHTFSFPLSVTKLSFCSTFHGSYHCRQSTLYSKITSNCVNWKNIGNDSPLPNNFLCSFFGISLKFDCLGEHRGKKCWNYSIFVSYVKIVILNVFSRF